MSRLLIVNPTASGVDERRLAAVVAELPSGTHVERTSAPGDATRLAHEAGSRVRAIYVFSGDGTYNEVLNGVEAATPLGFIPGGGTSVLPRALGLPRDPAAAARRVGAGRSRRIGLGRVNGRRFGFNAGVGLDAEIVRDVDRLGRRADGRRPGDVTFAWAALRAFARHRFRLEPVLELQGLGRGAFVLVANCSPYTYAGRVALHLVPGGCFDAGLAITSPTRLTPRGLPWLAALALAGRPAHAAGVLHARDLDRLVVRCDRPLPLQADGEDLGDVEHVVLESEPAAAAVLV